jgi:hypothetical protein
MSSLRIFSTDWFRSFGQKSKAPTIQRFLSGSGTYVTPAGVKYIKVRMVGGGGGGEGSARVFGGGGGNGGAGGNTTFGTSLLTANGGAGGAYAGIINGGSFTINSPAIAIASANGGNGQTTPVFWSQASLALNMYVVGGLGGNSVFGGGGSSPVENFGSDGKPNTGGGGGGGGIANVSANTSGDRNVGSGGGAGGYVEAIINNPLPSYTYSVGAGGTAGAAGSGGFNGGAGGSGIIIVEEYYF